MNSSNYEGDTSFPPKPIDYHTNLNSMLDISGDFKQVASWFAFSTAIISIFFNFLVLIPVTKRLKRQWNIDMMLVSIILSIDLIYGFWILAQHVALTSTHFQSLQSTAFVQINGFVLPLLIMASLFMVSILSLERYMFTVKGVRWTSTSYYVLAAGYLAPPVLLGLVGAATSQFMPMPSCVYSLVLIDKSSFAPIYLGFFTVQSIIAGMVFNASYLAILFHHRKVLLLKSNNNNNSNQIKPNSKKGKHKNGKENTDEVLSLPDMLEQPIPTNFHKFQLRTKDQSRSLANTLLYKTLAIMILYDIICLPEVVALVYETFTLTPRPVTLDFISVLFVSNHALVSPLVVMFLHQQTKEDLVIFRQEIRSSIKKFLGIKDSKNNNNNNSTKLDTFNTNVPMKQIHTTESNLLEDTNSTVVPSHMRSESQRFDRSILTKPSTLFDHDTTTTIIKENKDNLSSSPDSLHILQSTQPSDLNMFEIRVSKI